MGTLAIQYAKSKGAFVFTTTSSGNVNWVKDLGADRVIDYKTEDYKTIVKNADIVFDTLGQNYTLEAFELIKPGGKVFSVKGPFDEETAEMFGMSDYELPEELSKQISDKEAVYKYIFMHPNGAHLDDFRKLIESGAIKPVVEKVYPFSESIEAFKHLETGRAKGKIVIKIQ